MRGFQCHIYHLNGKNELIKNSNTVCYAGIRHYTPKTEIYIEQYEEPEITLVERKRLIKLVNKITPCSFVTIDNRNFIKFQMLHSYDSSLVVLNFIRNLWYPGAAHDKGYDNKLFFEKLKDKTYKDPLSKICYANKLACEKAFYSQGHSNIHRGASLKIKTVEELKKYNGSSTSGFLC